MISQKLGKSGPDASRIGYGCMELGERFASSGTKEEELRRVNAAIDAAIESGVNLFDHADIYGNGRSEELFGQVLSARPSLREEIVIQSKCGIREVDPSTPERPEYYDFSEEYILKSVDAILARLRVDYLDLLILHRPDALVEPEEVAEAFRRLHRDGKVRSFGVSNHNAAQIRLLKRYVDLPLVVNQVELSLMHADLIDEGVTFNDGQRGASPKGDGTLEYCWSEGITLQAWSPLGGGRLAASTQPGDRDARPALRDEIAKLAARYDASPEAVAIAWILRHPAKIQPIIGTTRPERIRDLCRAADLSLARWEWYQLLIASRGQPLP